MGWDIERLFIPEEHQCKFIFCNICFDVIEDPIQCRACQNHFCNQCIESWKKKNEFHCPNHCAPVFYKPAHRLMKLLLGDVEMRCINAPYGCSKAPKLKDLKGHEVDCKFKPAPCRYCKKEMGWILLEKHYEECEEWKWECPEKCSFVTECRQEKESHDCDQYAQEELDLWLEREREFNEKGGKDSDMTFVEMMTQVMKARLRKQMLETRRTLFAKYFPIQK